MDYPKPINSIDDLPKNYDGLARERHWQQYWAASRVYTFEPRHADGRARSRDELFTVDTPPPTVSGALHIGHVYSYTQTDMNVRYQRMKGKHVYYPFGFDDNGLPSERLVERVTGKRAHEVGREEFIALCKPVLESAEQEFKDLWQSLALSCDWDEFYTTIMPRSRAISQASFIDLYKKGYIYRKEAPTQWCWADQTAIAQAEIEDKEVSGRFHDITFHIDDGSGELKPVTIATTRPELVPACVAVFAHPDDERYRHLFGKVAITPLFEVEVPVLPSTKADPEKGTGILMCCTFGDTDDVEHWEEYYLPTRVIIERSGQVQDFSGCYQLNSELDCRPEGFAYSEEQRRRLSFAWPSRNPSRAAAFAGELAGLKIKAAREKIREQLREAGLLTAEREIMHIVRHSERGGVPIEILVTPQWYICILKHKAKLIEQGRKVRWHPEYMYKRFEHWVDGLNQDWCISRQRYNGVPFPVWYAMEGGQQRVILAGMDQLPVNPLADQPNATALNADREKHEALYSFCARTGVDPLAPLVPEPDVMDTWATSSITPLLNTHFMFDASDDELKARHAQLFPFDLRPQAHDIIRTWAFYTIAKAYFHFGEIPWHDIVISGHAQDAGHKKISKSKGHVVTPAELVEKYTADGLRYWSSGCKLGTDTLYDEKTLGEGKRLITKLFNASKFALRHLLDFDPFKASGADGPACGADGPAGGADGPVSHPSSPPRLFDPAALAALATYPTDRWILGRLSKTIERATKANEIFEFGDARQAAEDFFWADFCDNYLELSKGRLYGEPLALESHPGLDGVELKRSAQAALFLCLSAILKLFAPVLPHIAEECWSWYFAQWHATRGIHETPWPALSFTAAAEDERRGVLLTSLLALTRKWKSEHSISVKKPVAHLSVYTGADSEPNADSTLLEGVLGDLLSTCNAEQYSLNDGVPPDGAATMEGNPFAVDCELAEEA